MAVARIGVAIAVAAGAHSLVRQNPLRRAGRAGNWVTRSTERRQRWIIVCARVVDDEAVGDRLAQVDIDRFPYSPDIRLSKAFARVEVLLKAIVALIYERRPRVYGCQ